MLRGKRLSQVLGQLDQGVKEAWLIKKGPGYYSFADDKKRLHWAGRLAGEEERLLHRHIADILMVELEDDEKKAHAVAHHLIHINNDTEGCRYLVKAGDLCLQAFQTEEALQCYRKVLDDLFACR